MRGALGTFVAFLALAVVWTWPLAAHLSSRIPHDPGDPVLNVWLLWWNAQAVPFTTRWWSPPVFHPMQNALALSEHLAGIGFIATPLQLFGAGAVTAYNVALILSFALSAFFAFLLVRHLVDPEAGIWVRTIAGVCGGLAYGFAPYRAGQLAHLQVLTSQWMPLALLVMHLYLAGGRRRWLALLAGAWLVQALSNGYYFFFFPVLVGLWLAWFVDWRHAWRRGLAVAGTVIAASLLLVPVLLKYAAVHRALGLARTRGEMTLFSATPDSFLHTSGMLVFWPSSAARSTEDFLFPGMTPILLVAAACAAALYRRSGTPSTRSPLVFYASAALIMWMLALGPAPPDSPTAAWFRPYSFLAPLPGFDALRVPARFAMLATLCAATAAGLAFARVAPTDRLRRGLMAAGAVAGFVLDGWMRSMPLAPPPQRIMLPRISQPAVLELPAGEGAVDVAAMYRSTQHRHPLVNGYSGHMPPHYAILSIALRRRDPSVIPELARSRPLIIIVNTAHDAHGELLRLIEGVPGIQPHGSSSEGPIFVLPAAPAARLAPVGDPWPASVRHAPRDELEIDVGTERVIRTIAFPLRHRYAELDPRIVIRTSRDGAEWSTVWEGWTGGPALAAALQSPLEAPVRLTLPDVPARYLRVRPVPSWMAGELKVYGPR